MAQLAGENFPIIKLYEIVRILTFEVAGYVGAVPTDLGKPVDGANSGDSGTLLEYDNGTRTWKVRPDDNGDLFDEVEVVSVTGGTGTGTTTGASTTALRIKEYYAFSGLDMGGIVIDCPPDLDGKPILLGSRKKKVYRAGYWTNFDIIFLFDNDNPGMSKDADDNDLNDCQTFLLNLLNHDDVIKVQPHSDQSEEYQVWLPGGWSKTDIKLAYERSYGYRGILHFEGLESIAQLDFKK